MTNAEADVRLLWAKEAVQLAHNPAAWFTDRMADPEKYVTPKR